MSVIATLAQLFQRSAVPSVESTLTQLTNRPSHLPVLSPGEIRERAISNLRTLLGPDVTVSQQTLGTALGRIQTAIHRGEAIERGETVPRQLIPIDPTIPIGTEFRYRVKVDIDIPGVIPGLPVQTITTVIPVDSDTELTRQQIADRVQPALSLLSRTSGSPRFEQVGEAVSTQEVLDQRITVISVYRSPIG